MSASRARIAAIVAAILLLAPSPADAHLVNTGFGPFYDGISHLLVTAEDLLVVIALGLLAGLAGRQQGRGVLWMLPGAWLLGGLVGLSLPVAVQPALATILTFLAAGALVAADRRLPSPVIPALTIVAGLLHGYLNGVEAATARLGVTGLLGSVTTVFVIVTLAAGLAASRPADWTRIAVRVAGSWIAAIGMLLLGWSLRPDA